MPRNDPVDEAVRSARLIAHSCFKHPSGIAMSPHSVICSAGSMTSAEADAVITALTAAGYVITKRPTRKDREFRASCYINSRT